MTVLVSPVNVSEGRRPEVVAAIAAAGEGAGGALLDVHSDPDHNRSVLTFAAPAGDLVEALLAVGAAVVTSLDLAAHRGVHPRIGTLDVVPFVPRSLGDWETAEAAARSFAEGMWAAEQVPSFFYGIGHRSLPEVRRQAWRGLAPDVGGPGPHPRAGAIAVGVRGPLVAFNVDLDSPDVALARRIAGEARRIPGVRALGLALASRGVTQVSMNLVDPLVTGVGDAYDAVAASAAAAGVAVAGSEVVGLAPRGALPASPERLHLVRPVRVLEEELDRRGFTPYD